MKPSKLFILLALAGIFLVWLLQKTQREDAAATVSSSTEDFEKMVHLLEGQVEYLQEQVRVLQEENSQMLDKLGRLGMENSSGKMDAVSESEADLVGLGLELMKLRELRAMPLPTTIVPGEMLEREILQWLRRMHPEDEGLRSMRALHGLGWVPEIVDPLPLRAALLRLQLGAWYDGVNHQILLEDEDHGLGEQRLVLGMAVAHLLREHGEHFLPDNGRRLTLDESLARQSLLMGDAAVTRFFFLLRNPNLLSGDSIPSEDPDHPFNGVEMPRYLRELHFFPFNQGYEFAQALHSAGSMLQLDTSYARPPLTSLEILDTERYWHAADQVMVYPTLSDVEVDGRTPFWRDRLGPFALLAALRNWVSPELAADPVQGWLGDELIAYSRGTEARADVVLQTWWQDAGQASSFLKAMQTMLESQHGAQLEKGDNGLFQLGDRRMLLILTDAGQGVRWVDVLDDEQGLALLRKLNP